MIIQLSEEVHIWHCIRFEFNKGNNATVAKGGFLSSGLLKLLRVRQSENC